MLLSINSATANVNRLYYKFIKNDVTVPLQHEIDRLREEGGLTKASHMEKGQGEIHGLILNKVVKIKSCGDVPSCCQSLNTELQAKMSKMCQSPDIHCNRNEVKAFFKKLAGVLLAAPLGFTPLLSQRYCQFFFRDQATASLEKTNSALLEKSKSLELEVEAALSNRKCAPVA